LEVSELEFRVLLTRQVISTLLKAPNYRLRRRELINLIKEQTIHQIIETLAAASILKIVEHSDTVELESRFIESYEKLSEF
jgi:hypothetical protein